MPDLEEFASVDNEAAHAVATPSPDDLRVTRIRALRGPNYWRLAPVIACDVRLGALEKMSTAELPGFVDAIIQALPTLIEHECSRGTPGGFAAVAIALAVLAVIVLWLGL